MPTPGWFKGEIRVASRIVDYLSSGLYRSPAACLKELINNSFDADAREVNVFVKPDANRIIIEDDGIGMDQADFQKHFSVISESHKRDGGEHTKSGRPKIGKIGIGFIAANEICDTMQILSTKAGSKDLLNVTIHFDVMRKNPESRRREENTLAKADYEGTIEEAKGSEHFTQIILKDVRGEARSILSGAGTSKYENGAQTLYGLKRETIAAILGSGKIASWKNFDAYSRNMLEIGANVPVQYHDGWIPPRLSKHVRRFEKKTGDLGFSLFIDGSEIRKPTMLEGGSRAFISPFSFEGRHVSAQGYFYAQHGAIKPQEIQGLILRIRNASVGDYDQSFLAFSPSTGALFQSWISAELWADDRLEDAMNIDRRTLRIAHPAYVELQNAVHEHLFKLIQETRTRIYLKASEERKKAKTLETSDGLSEVLKDPNAGVPPSLANKILRKWAKVSDKGTTSKRLSRKYSCDEIYDLVTTSAKGVLTSKQLERLLLKLTERLAE